MHGNILSDDSGNDVDVDVLAMKAQGSDLPVDEDLLYVEGTIYLYDT